MKLSDKWAPRLLAQGETGMGYQVATITLKDGQRFDQALIVGNVIAEIRHVKEISFKEEDIADIVVTNDKWKTE